MSGGAGLHADKAGRQSAEKSQDIAAAQRPAHQHLADCVNAMNLEDILRKVQPDRGHRPLADLARRINALYLLAAAVAVLAGEVPSPREVEADNAA
jgi:hypothetical protein